MEVVFIALAVAGLGLAVSLALRQQKRYEAQVARFYASSHLSLTPGKK